MICSIFAPAAIEFNRMATPSKYAKIAFLMGEEIEGLSSRDSAMKSIDAVKKLIQDLDLPNNLKSVGIKKEHVSAIAKKASQKVDIEGNPRPIKYENLLKITNQVYND
jgi:alcohol dehydrogenase class IV